MTEPRKSVEQGHLKELVEAYLGLESLEITETLVELCGASIDARALPLLRQRLQEEEAQGALLEARGYTRMCEKSQQLVASLIPLIAALEGKTDDQPG